MSIVKLKKREELRILFGVRLPDIVMGLYKEMKNTKRSNEVIREILNMDPKRVFTVVDVQYGSGEEALLLVIYDNLMEERELLKYNLEVDKFDFRILEFDFNNKIDVEELILRVKRSFQKGKGNKNS